VKYATQHFTVSQIYIYIVIILILQDLYHLTTQLAPRLQFRPWMVSRSAWSGLKCSWRGPRMPIALTNPHCSLAATAAATSMHRCGRTTL